MKILICDDEPLARDRLRHMIDGMAGFYVTEKDASNGVEAIERCRSQQPDIVLMDMRMPTMGGLEAAAHLAKLPNPPAVVFSTAYDTHAVEAFRVHAVGYLLKPVVRAQLEETLTSVSTVNRVQLAGVRSELENRDRRSTVSASTIKGVNLLSLDDIYYLKADNKYVTAYHRTGEMLLDETLKELESEFAHTFIRIHRNTLVSRRFVRKMTRDQQGAFHLHLASVEEPLLISRRLVSKIKRFMMTL